ncbi:MAG: efflux RND transporter periplasmic adaptor subunit [Streptosporangiaceae bacterium]
MSETVSRDSDSHQQDDATDEDTAQTRRGHRGRRQAVGAAIAVVVLAAGAGVAWSKGAFRSHDSSGIEQGAAAPATQTVVRETLSSQTPVTATLGYAGSYTVRGQSGGILTSLPSAGQVIRQGQVLYRVDNGVPVVLLYGSVPAWRTLDEGVTGSDVTQLNHDLVTLGYANSSDISALGWDYFSWETADGVENLESALGVSNPPGSLALGSMAFEPTGIRVSNVLGTLGGAGYGPVLAGTSDNHVVTISLSTAAETGIAVGNAVSVALPNGDTTEGKISTIGTVASGTSTNATIQVTVTLNDPSAAGALDQAPVTVYITTDSASDALVVPVGALVAQSSGGYSVEVVGAGNTRRLVPVQVGIFDDSSGLVQVAGALTPGEKVVVPAS